MDMGSTPRRFVLDAPDDSCDLADWLSLELARQQLDTTHHPSTSGSQPWHMSLTSHPREERKTHGGQFFQAFATDPKDGTLLAGPLGRHWQSSRPEKLSSLSVSCQSSGTSIFDLLDEQRTTRDDPAKGAADVFKLSVPCTGKRRTSSQESPMLSVQPSADKQLKHAREDRVHGGTAFHDLFAAQAHDDCHGALIPCDDAMSIAQAQPPHTACPPHQEAATIEKPNAAYSASPNMISDSLDGNNDRGPTPALTWQVCHRHMPDPFMPDPLLPKAEA